MNDSSIKEILMDLGGPKPVRPVLKNMVRIQNESGISNDGTKITDADTGATIHGVTKAIITFEYDQLITATLQICMIETDFRAMPRFELIHPVTGKFSQVKAIEFTDGEKWTA